MTGGSDDRPYYGRARIAAGLMLIGLVMALLLIDALSFDYHVDSIQLGVEAGRKLLGGG
jgi:hypothetical protein